MTQPFTNPADEPTPPVPFLSSYALESGTLLTVEQLVRRAFEQNAEQGYELLFRRFYRPLCSHAVRYVYAKEVAEDLVSDVFLNLWRTEAYRSIQTTFQAYLFGAVRNRVLNYLRDQALHQPVEVGAAHDVVGALADDPQHILQVTELQARIHATIAGLPPQCQRVFMLSRFEGKTYAQIADQLQLSVKTVETHLGKALATLRQLLTDEPLLTAPRPTDTFLP